MQPVLDVQVSDPWKRCFPKILKGLHVISFSSTFTVHSVMSLSIHLPCRDKSSSSTWHTYIKRMSPNICKEWQIVTIPIRHTYSSQHRDKGYSLYQVLQSFCLMNSKYLDRSYAQVCTVFQVSLWFTLNAWKFLKNMWLQKVPIAHLSTGYVTWNHICASGLMVKDNIFVQVRL